MIIHNGKAYAVKLDDDKGALISLVYGKKEFVCQESILPLFAVRLRGDKGEKTYINAYDATERRTFNEDNTYQLEFSGFEKADLRVKVSVEFSEQINWKISVENLSELCIEWIDFPQIAVPDDLKGSGGDGEIFWGFNEGAVVDDIDFRESSWFNYDDPEYPSKGTAGVFPGAVEMPYMAYYGKSEGLYFAAHDRDGNVKGIDFHKEGSGIKLQFRLFSGLDAGQDFDMEYSLVMAFFNGDWYDAAEIYRTWFEEKINPEFVPIKENPLIPEWYGRSPVIVTYPVRGLHDTDIMNPNKLFPYIAAMPHIERLAKELDSPIMVILMHWEGTAPWAPPYVWPPFGGEKALREFTDELHKQGHLIGLYCSGLGWTYQSKLIKEYNNQKSFEEDGLSEFMCLSPEGDLPFSNICPAQRVGYDLCPTQDYTINVITSEVEKMVSGDVDYIQLMDQNHGGTSYFCYSRNHGHPAIPGKWQTDAVKSLFDKVRAISKGNGKKVLFGCESAAAEPYIPHLLFSDNRFEICFAIGRAVPAYAYVYHQYINNFMGNQVCAHEFFNHAQSPENLLYRISYAFCAGDMLTLVINDEGQITWNWGEKEMPELPNQANVIKLTRNLNSWRRGVGKPFLHEGRMVKPFEIVQPEPIEISTRDGHTLSCNPIMTTCWKSDNGEIGQILVNYGLEPITCKVKLDAVNKYSIYNDAFGDPGAEGKASDSGNGEIEITIEALSAIMIVCQ